MFFYNKKNIWDQKERDELRLNANLPILKSKDEFLKRLRKERVVVIVAETGSGKTTQLPQYMAEEFKNEKGLIVVTQPRVLAAVSVAERVGLEFDGPIAGGVGHSVNYKVGKTSSKPRKKSNGKILFMTDSQLIREMGNDRLLSKIKVLLVDEAHERSMNTDIVLGIAKHLLSTRKNDFYVVVASATIDPRMFLDFFDQIDKEPMQVPGRVFPVATYNWPKTANDDDKSITLSVDFVVEKTLKAVNEFDQGHTLVFLPSQKDVESCVQKFLQQAPLDFEALPLFGSLSAEEQMKVIEFEKRRPQGKNRLVAFCTNVAETSLTVDGVKLVIDTGLAKEAKYDTKRRSTVLELTWISKASADQRKGRAGRTSTGTCIRLYSENELKRDAIEPEILRSNIDMVVLQLKLLKLDAIPLITRPDNWKWDMAFESLRLIGALDFEYKITELGIIFSSLPFDPLISAFAIDLYAVHSTDVGILTAALITAPGEIFYFGNKDSRDENMKTVADKASNFDSDIMFKVDVFEKWKQCGSIRQSTKNVGSFECATCLKRFSDEKKNCKNCQIKHTKLNRLNNQVLKYIDSTATDVKSVLQKKMSSIKYSSGSLSNVMSHDENEKEEECLSKALAYWMYEQSVHTVVPNMPVYGVRIISSNEKSQIDSKSCVVNRKLRASNQYNNYFVSVSPFFRISKPNGELIFANNLHPVSLEYLKLAKDEKWANSTEIDKEITLVHTESSVGPLIANSKVPNTNCTLKWNDWLKELIIHEDTKLCTSIYDKNECSVQVYGPKYLQESIQRACLRVFQTIRASLVDKESKKTFYLCNKSFLLLFKSGFQCTNLKAINEKVKIVLDDVRYRTYDEFSQDFFDKYKVKKVDLASHNLNTKTKKLTLVFKDTMKAMEFNAKLNDLREKDFVKSNHNSSESNMSASLKFSSKKMTDISVESVSRLLNVGIKNVNVILKKFTLRIDKLQSGFALPNWIPRPIKQNRKENVSKKSTGSTTLFLEYPNLHELNTAYQTVQSEMWRLCYTAVIPGGKSVRVAPVATMLPETIWTSEFESIEDAESVFQNRGVFEFHQLKISTEIFDNFQDRRVFTNEYKISIANEIETTYLGSNCSIVSENDRVKVKTLNVAPSQIAKARKKIKSKFTPIELVLPKQNDPVRRFYFEKLFNNSELLEHWSKTFNVEILVAQTVMKVYGEQIALGNLMMHIGDHYQDFVDRFAIINLNADEAMLFENNRIGAAELEKLKNLYDAAFIYISYCEKNIQVCVDEMSAFRHVLPLVKKEIDDLRKSLVERVENHSNNSCIYCNTQTSFHLSICGHKVCKSCLQILITYEIEFPIRCKCKSPIYIDNITENLSLANVDKLVKNSAKSYLNRNKATIKIRFCHFECDGLISEDGFVKCTTCSKGFCNLCESTDETHEGKTCDEYEKFKKNFACEFTEVIREARKWTQSNWGANGNKLINIIVNPYLSEENCEALQLFELGVKRLALSNVLQNGFFAWHGAPESAIESICNQGFDPTKRNAQWHGPGEYFGVSSDVSLAYCRGSNFMLVAFILKGHHVKEALNFCYVVNNPTDKRFMYCLPVCIVNFGVKKSLGIEIQTKTVPTKTQPIAYSHTASANTQPIAHSRSVTSETKDSNVSYSFSWMQDDGQYKPYSSEVNKKLEASLMEYVKSGKHPARSVVTISLFESNSNQPQNYYIDFEGKTQQNTSTNFIRRIKFDYINDAQNRSTTPPYSQLFQSSARAVPIFSKPCDINALTKTAETNVNSTRNAKREDSSKCNIL